MEVRKEGRQAKGFISRLFAKRESRHSEYAQVSLSHVYVLHTYLRNITPINFPGDLNKLGDLLLLLESYMFQNDLTGLSLYKTVTGSSIAEIKKDREVFYKTKRNLVFHLLAMNLIKN